MADWQPIETAPKPKADEPCWIIGYTAWGQHAGKFHKWVGPCEYHSYNGESWFEFTNTDFDMFPRPTHWHPWPEAPKSEQNDDEE